MTAVRYLRIYRALSTIYTLLVSVTYHPTIPVLAKSILYIYCIYYKMVNYP